MLRTVFAIGIAGLIFAGGTGPPASCGCHRRPR